MQAKNPFRYFNSSPEVIRYAVWLYSQFPLSLRQVEDLLIERGIDVTYETLRFWHDRFAPLFAMAIRRRRNKRGFGSKWRWHLDEVFVKINGKQHYLWRAVDHEGEVLECYVTLKRNREAALRFLKKAMKKYGVPYEIVTDKLASYGAALREMDLSHLHTDTKGANNRAENSHLPFRRREQARKRFRSMKSLQKVTASHGQIYNHFNQDRHLSKRNNFKANRAAALDEWRTLELAA